MTSRQEHKSWDLPHLGLWGPLGALVSSSANGAAGSYLVLQEVDDPDAEGIAATHQSKEDLWGAGAGKG